MQHDLKPTLKNEFFNFHLKSKNYDFNFKTESGSTKNYIFIRFNFQALKFSFFFKIKQILKLHTHNCGSEFNPPFQLNEKYF